MSTFALRLPDDLKEIAVKQAEDNGVSLNQYFASAIASRIGAQAEAERFFKKRASKANLQLATDILSRSGTEMPRVGDELPVK
jgi:hypothetical protein